ncbi:MAG: AAA family ATPase [Magnetococcales bacterium]|nr:AAA family ATPase [Magnetococcales bacterium]
MDENRVLDQVVERAGEIILGKKRAIRLALVCLLARGHLLIEDLPGVGKTTLSHVLAKVLGLGFRRIQFTSDLLPADILGVSIFDRRTGGFEFHPGPIFSQVILADEVNRATPKAQSALLEAMEERQVTVEGTTRPLPEPFFVIATQNPSHQIGTFPLPESQLDRFLMRVQLGFPGPQAERELLRGEDRRTLLNRLEPLLEPSQLQALQKAATQPTVSSALLDYLQALLAFSRDSGHYQSGLSPRAGLALLHAARAHAFLERQKAVLPEDIQAVLPSVANHRLHLDTPSGDDPVRHLLESVAVP